MARVCRQPAKASIWLHQAVVVKARRMRHHGRDCLCGSIGSCECSLFPGGFLFQKALSPDSEEHPACFFR